MSSKTERALQTALTALDPWGPTDTPAEIVARVEELVQMYADARDELAARDAAAMRDVPRGAMDGEAAEVQEEEAAEEDWRDIEWAATLDDVCD